MRSLSYKIGLGYLALIVINIALSVFAVYHISRLSQPYSRLLKEKYRNVNTAENILRVISRQELIQFKMVEGSFNPGELVRFNTYKNEFREWYEKAQQELALPKEPLILDSLEMLYRDYLARSDSLQNIIFQRKGYKQVKNYHSRSILPYINKISELCLELKELNEQAIESAGSRAQQLSQNAKIGIVLFAIFALLLSIIISIYLTRRIVRPLKETTEKVRRIGQGNFDQKVQIRSDDEIARLGLEFNRMSHRLQTYEEMNVNQLLAEKKKTEAIVAQIPAGIIVTDQDNRLILLNRRAQSILHISGEEWFGRPLVEILKKSPLTDSSLFLQGKAAEDSEVQTLTVTAQDGSVRYYSVDQQAIKGSDGQFLGRVVFLQDVTEFKNLDQLKSDFMAAISHEIKTPLTSMNLAVDLLLKGSTNRLKKEQQELLETIKSDVRRLKDFIHELLELSRMESGSYPFARENCSVVEMINTSLQTLRMLQKEKNLHTDIHVPRDAGQIRGDTVQLTRVLSNLIKNAFEHSPQDAIVEITVSIFQDKLRFCVRDYGPGIPQKALSLIFDKFVQTGDFDAAGKGNMGLGLAISREIVKGHSGKIWAESEPGRGSRFYFELPFLREK